MSQIFFITGLNPQFIQTGFFVVKNVGIRFPKIVNIYMEAQESPNDKLSSKLTCKN
tara:strand:- start:142 stop:309 length:168 start_codon:yes stop_codon:yes gene_type:complete